MCRVSRLVAIGALSALAVVAAACGDDSVSSSSTTVAPGGDPASAREDVTGAEGKKLSIVVIGDSIASGEGIAYGYTYDYDSSSPNSSHWTGGTENPTWQGQYQLCHDDAKAYPDVAAAALGADLAKFACTGATYLNGIITEQTAGSGTVKTVRRPAQFGNWSTKQDLNHDYDTAAPDVVVITFGADDVQFSSIVKYCVLGTTTADPSADQSIASAEDPVAAIDQALAARAPELRAARESGDTSLRDDSGSSYCTAANPGATIDKLFWDPINSGEIAQHYKDIVTAIHDRGKDPDHGKGKVPKIIFTTYHRPLPEGLDGDCWDVWPLSSAEQQYLQSLQDTMQKTLEGAVTGLDGVTIADISSTVDGHEWCTPEPWVYGLSIINYDYDTDSPAPFHPTPDGQAAIAGVVEKAIRDVTSED